MKEKEAFKKICLELHEGMKLTKCRKCGCMQETLEHLKTTMSGIEGFSESAHDIENWLSQMKPIKYTCLGYEHCFPALASNLFQEVFPSLRSQSELSCAFEVRQTWPPVAGEYFALCEGSLCPVAVSTLASVDLAEKIAKVRPKELSIVGKTETENIGIDKVIKNTITNPTIRILLVAGNDPKGHQSGRTLLALKENGVDEKMRVVGSPGKQPVLKNVTKDEVEVFRKQIQIVDLIGCEDTETIIHKIKEVAGGISPSYNEVLEPAFISTVPKVQAKEPTRVEVDKAGHFVIIPSREKRVISVEHYSYENKLLHIIEGKNAPAIYSTIIENGWITQLSHAAYLGKELSKAELALKHGFKYIQDRAP